MLELLVGLLKLFLAGLKFPGELLALLEQSLGAHRRFNRIEHDADRLGKLFKEI